MENGNHEKLKSFSQKKHQSQPSKRKKEKLYVRSREIKLKGRKMQSRKKKSKVKRKNKKFKKLHWKMETTRSWRVFLRKNTNPNQ